ncbi:MAG: hypothetical protein KGJ13_03600 [Patescibacteria group bacterium]|nr:hypothetical protein [Patescibacteria group bacterium]
MNLPFLILLLICVGCDGQSIAPPGQIVELTNMVPALFPTVQQPVSGTISWRNSIARTNAFSVLYHSEDLKNWTAIWSNPMQLQMSVQVLDENSNDFFRVANEIPGMTH